MTEQHDTARLVEGASDTRTVAECGGVVVGRFQGGETYYLATVERDA